LRRITGATGRGSRRGHPRVSPPIESGVLRYFLGRLRRYAIKASRSWSVIFA
jgi:hypothetical protein